jgi:iron(III) transport system substrate-binding protein
MPRLLIVCFYLAAALAPCAFAGCSGSPRVVLYSAQDREFAEGLLQQFREQTGLAVAPKFDTEANKSVSLYRELVEEGTRPRCDVFWNNEILSTIRLQRAGLLEPYASPSAEPFPKEARAADNTWTAFATRGRILIVNTSLLPERDRPASILELTQEKWRGRVVMARPMFGTSATQAAVLFEVLGSERARTFYQGLKANGVQLAPGNKQVAEWVGQGRTPTGQVVAVGITDTDDAAEEVRAGHPVAIVYPDQNSDLPRMGTLFLPNTLCILKGCPNPEGARKLVDFLLSPESEKALAEGPSVQAPLNPQVKATLPAGIRSPHAVRSMRVHFEKAADLWDEAQTFLVEQFGGP